MSDFGDVDPFSSEEINDILHSRKDNASLATVSCLSRSDDTQRRNENQLARTQPANFFPGQAQVVDQISPPKKFLTPVRVAPFNKSTHIKDQQEFSSKRPMPLLTKTNNVACEYSNIIGGSVLIPKRPSLSQALESRRQQKQLVFNASTPASTSRTNHSSPATRLPLPSCINQDRWKATGKFALKQQPISALGSLRRSGSDVIAISPSLPKKANFAATLPSHFSGELSPPTKKHRRGETVENPVELSDDDEAEIEEREIHEVWSKGISTDIAIGQIWFGKCRLLSHGPSRLLLDVTAISSNKNLTIEFTPYMIEQISLDHILETKAYLRLSGGCTFISVLISSRHQWQDWALQYKFRSSQSESVWITMFFGASSLRNVLETVSIELPCYEEIVCPSDHLNAIAQGLIDQYPLRRLRLDVNSKVNKRKVQKQVICRYPAQSRECITITNGDLGSLDPHEFLNDTVIDFKLTHLRVSDTSPKFSYHIFSSFFYKRFVTSNLSYASVKRWTDKQDLFTKDFWLIPICEALHWTLAVVCYPNIKRLDNRTPVMLYYDSLGGSGKRAFDVIRKYIESALAQPRKLRSLDSIPKIESEFQLINVRVPRQTNSYDCGIYLLLFAEYFLRDPPKDVCSPHQPEWFEQSVADGHRNKIRTDILKLAYAQSAGTPDPVSTDYVHVRISVNDEDGFLPAFAADKSIGGRFTEFSTTISSATVEDASVTSSADLADTNVHDLSAGNNDSVIIV